MRKKMLLTVLAVALCVAMIAAATMAWFTDTDNAGEATFTAGVLNIDVNKALTAYDGLDHEVTKIDHMNPGDSFGPFIIDIENKGTKKLAWFGDWEFSYVDQLDHNDGDKLLDALYVKSAKMEFLKPNPAYDSNDPNETDPQFLTWEPADEFIKDGRGWGPYPDAFNDLADLSVFTHNKYLSLRNFDNNHTMITLPGSHWEHMGALKAGNRYRLTVTFGFNSEAGNEYQGDRDLVSPIKIGFKVDATQVNAEAINGEIMTGLADTTLMNWLEAQINKQ